MLPAPTNAVESLSFLLKEWVSTAFPAQARDVAVLNHLWLNLAAALCGTKKSHIKMFQQELSQLRSTTRAGEPPTKSLEHRLYELIDADLREFFLIIAVRQAMEQLILIEAPSTLDVWKQLADTILPLQLQFAHGLDEAPPQQTTLSPDL